MCRPLGMLVISTHSLTRRLTSVSVHGFVCVLNFNSQPHKEADIFSTRPYSAKFISTHSLTRRLTTHVCFVCVRGGHFNSQPHKEADSS